MVADSGGALLAFIEVGLISCGCSPPLKVGAVASCASIGGRAVESIMRALVLSLCRHVGDRICWFRPGPARTLRGVFGPPGSTPPAAKSGKSTFSAPDYGAVGTGPRVTISARPSRGQTLPSDVTSRSDLRSARLRHGDRQRPSHDCRPQQQSHRPSPGLDTAIAEGGPDSIGSASPIAGRSTEGSRAAHSSPSPARCGPAWQKPTIVNFLSTRLGDD